MVKKCAGISFLGALILSGCGVSMKPNHVQEYGDFSQRRVPEQNVLVQSGQYDALLERRSGFAPYQGGVVLGSGQKGDKISGVKNDVSAVINNEQQSKSGLKQEEVPNKEGSEDLGGGVLDKIKKLFSEASDLIGDEKRFVPIENLAMNDGSLDVMLAAEESFQIIEQGSNTQEISDNLDDGKMVLAAAKNASAPLVEVPSMKSHEEIRVNSDAVSDVVLQSPEVDKRLPVEKKQNIEGAYHIKDQTATLQYQNGKLVVSGQLSRR